MLTFGSLFAGIGGFDLGFERAGMKGIWQVEIDSKCRALLAKRFPHAKQYEDVRTVGASNLERVNIICGGFPCQDLSVAGKRAGLIGTRSGLFFEMTRIVNELQPDFLIWENVPGLLSSHRGKDFLHVLMELERIGYCGCWTALDARWFGVAQRRCRVFGVFTRRDIGAARCAEILSLQARLHWDSEQSQAAGCVSAPLTATGVGAGRTGNERNELDFCVPTMRANGDAHSGFVDEGGLVPDVARSQTTREGMRQKIDQDNFIAVRTANTSSNGKGILEDGTTHTLGGSSDAIVFQQNTRDEVHLMNGDGQIAGALLEEAGMKQQNYLAFNNRQDLAISGDVTNPLGAKDNGLGVLGWLPNQGSAARGLGIEENIAPTLRASNKATGAVGVRRLTPLECERLQGFPDGWTEGFADSTRYKMLGNAVAVPCVEWIGRRIVETENA